MHSAGLHLIIMVTSTVERWAINEAVDVQSSSYFGLISSSFIHEFYNKGFYKKPIKVAQFVVICSSVFFLHRSAAFDSLMLAQNQNTVRNMDKPSTSDLSEVIKQNQKTSHKIFFWKHELAELDTQTLSSLSLSLARILTLKQSPLFLSSVLKISALFRMSDLPLF